MSHARGFLPLVLVLIIAAVLAIASVAGWWVTSTWQAGASHSNRATTMAQSLLPIVGRKDVSIPFAHLAFILPQGWSVSRNRSGIASSSYDQNTLVPYAAMDIADAGGKTVATLQCPPKATGMEQMGDLYGQATASQRSFAQGTTTYNSSFEYVVDYGPGHTLDYSKPRVVDTFVSNGEPVVPSFSGELQSCQIADNSDFSQSTIDGIAAIYRSWQAYPQVAPLSASATIDPTILRQETPPQGLDWAPTLSGTASGLSVVFLYVNGQQMISANVVDGRWETSLPNSKISYPAGSYAISARDKNGNVLAQATLTVVDAITVDPGSWNPQGNRIDLKGTAASLDKLFITVFHWDQPRTVVATGTVAVANGHWSYVTALPPGTYFVWVEDGTKPITWVGNSPQGDLLWASPQDELTVVN